MTWWLMFVFSFSGCVVSLQGSIEYNITYHDKLMLVLNFQKYNFTLFLAWQYASSLYYLYLSWVGMTENSNDEEVYYTGWKTMSTWRKLI